jgi:hypothetical protein
MTPVANLPCQLQGKFATNINDTGAKFATGTAGVIDTCGKFATNDTGGK